MDVACAEAAVTGTGARSGPARPAFEDVARRELDAVYRYLLHMTGQPALAEDLTSATFERALRDWRRYDPAKAGTGVWLVEIARRQLLDHRRREGRRWRREQRWAATEPVSGPPPEVGGLSAPMRAALGRLSDAERELVALRVVLGVDTAETAMITGMSPTAVSSALHRALGRLRAGLTSQGTGAAAGGGGTG
jgi:RNA polymerase sigma-70 factor (ECF subfamily)